MTARAHYSTADVPAFSTATADGEIVEKDSYHQPDTGRRATRCGCSKTTRKGAYRDVTVELDDGRTVHYYHQTAVVVEHPNGSYTLNSGGYRTSTTKERINRHLPAGYRLIQRDFEWYVVDPDGDRIDFSDGMEIDP